MNILSVIKKVGAGIIGELPGGSLLLNTVNALLPSDKQLPATATGKDVENVLATLPEADRAALLSKEFDVDLAQIKESNSTLRTMLDADAANPQSTRPYIAKHSFHVIAFTIVATILVWGYGVMADKPALVKVVMDGWPFLLGLTAPLAVLLRSYFGVLQQEHQSKLNAATGSPQPGGLTGLVSSLIKR